MANILAKDLRNAILQDAVQGKLTSRYENDTSVDILLSSIKKQKEQLINDKKIKNDKIFPPIREDDIPFEIPNEWRWVRLQNISKRIFAGGDKPKNFSLVATDENIYPVIANSKVNDGILGYTNTYNAQEGTITMAARGSNVGLTTYRPYKYLPIVRLIVIELLNGINPKYFQIALSIIGQSNTGTAIPQITVPMLIDKILPLPPVEEQQRIVERVEELMVKIDEYEKIENQLVKLKKQFPADMCEALYQAALQGKLTTQLCGENVNDFADFCYLNKQNLIKSNKIKKDKTTTINEDEIPFDIPNNWVWTKLGNLAHLKTGKTPPRAEPDWWGSNEDIPWIAISDMIPNGYVKETKEFISRKGLKEKFGGKISPKNTLIMSFKLTIGRVSILDIDALHNEAIISIIPYFDVNYTLRNYLFKILPFMTKYGNTKNAIKGSTLNSDSLCNLYIPLPPLEEQQRIVEILDKLLPLCEGLAHY